MINRRLLPLVAKDLTRFPVVALLGPRQVGKTTLAQRLARGYLVFEKCLTRFEVCFLLECVTVNYAARISVNVDDLSAVTSSFSVARVMATYSSLASVA